MRITAYWRTLARIGILLAAIGTVVAMTDVHVFDLAWNRRLLAAIAAIQPLVLLVTYMGAVRFALLVRSPPIPVWPSFKALVLANGLNVVMPSHLGELAKPTYLRDHQGIPLSEGLGSVVIERATDILVLAILALAGISLLVVAPNTMFLLAACAVAAAFLMLPKAAGLIPRLIRLLPWPPLRDFSDRLLQHVARRLKDRATYLALGVGVVLWVTCWFYTALFLSIAGDRPLDFSAGLLVLLATTVGGAVPALPGGLGTYEAAAVVVLKGLGYGFEEAIVVAVALHLSQLLVGSAGAAAVIALEHIGIGSLLSQLRSAAKERGARAPTGGVDDVR